MRIRRNSFNAVLLVTLGLFPALVATPNIARAARAESAARPPVKAHGAPGPRAVPAPPQPSVSGPSKPAQPTPEDLAEMRREKDGIEARLALETARRSQKLAQARAEIDTLNTEADLAAARFKKWSEQVRSQQASTQAENVRLTAEREQAEHRLAIFNAKHALEMRKLDQRLEVAKAEGQLEDRVLAKLDYRVNPLVDGVLEITDRRIALNGVITMKSAELVSERISFFNNKDKRYPIFIVIDYSPGGSAMAGYQILKAMESSDAPVHVVVKSFAASMAAVITTVAPHSWAYPNAIMLHHQISSGAYGNLTQQKERVREVEQWSKRLMKPVGREIGLTEEQFVREMYRHNSDGNWSEFADRAVQLKWVDRVAKGVRERGVIELAARPKSAPAAPQLEERVDGSGKSHAVLPRLQPFDCWFLHDPDGYYR